MKKAYLVFAAVFLFALTGCEERTLPPSSSAAVSSPNSSLSSTQQERSSEVQESGSASLPQIDERFVEEVVLNFGGKREPDNSGKEVIRPQAVSLYYLDGFTSETLTPGNCFSWYFSYSSKEELTDEERAERYSNPKGENMGWFYPATFYEPVVMRYFNVTKDFLRSDEAYYDSSLNGYTVDGGGGVGERPEIQITGSKLDGDLLFIDLTMPFQYEPAKSMRLTIQLDKSGGYKYLSYQKK